MRYVICLLLITLTVSLVSTAQVGDLPNGWIKGAELRDAQVVVIAIDTSGSIAAAKLLPDEKTMAILIVRFLARNNPAVALQIVTFNSDIKVVWPKPPLVTDSPVGNLPAVEVAIRGIRDTNNLTWLNGVIDYACSITDPADPTGMGPGPGTGTLVGVTDSKPTTATRNGPRNIAAAKAATRAAAAKFRVNCSTLAIIGVDVTLEDEQFLREIASPNAYLYLSTSRIAVGATNTDRETDIYVMNSDGTELTNLTNTPDDMFEAPPIWSPDGTRLMFASCALGSCDGYDGPYEIHSVNSDGTDLKNLTNTPHIHETYPSWSPDGTRIAFASCTLGRCDVHYGPYDIYVMNSDGTELTNLTDTPDWHESYPVWSPDGTQIMFRLGSDLHVMDDDGSNWRKLTNNLGQVRAPDWSPDGARIVFSADTDLDDHFEIWMVDVGGSHPGNLTRLTEIGDSRYPTWSPDGTLIAFARCDDADPWNIYVMRPDGSGQKKLTDHADQLGLYLYYGPCPVWSLYGRMIAYYGEGAFIDSQYEWRGIVVMSADGSNQSVILESTGLENHDWMGCSRPAWEPRPAYDE